MSLGPSTGSYRVVVHVSACWPPRLLLLSQGKVNGMWQGVYAT